MSSKKTKSTKESKVDKKSPRKKSYQHELVVPDCWVNELAELNVNDESWKCSVTIIEEESSDSSVYMEHFNEATINGNRLAVKSVSKLEIIHFVIKNMTENHQGKSLTPLKLLCSEVFKLVGPEFEKKIPTPLLASLIKYLILEYKDLNKTIKEGIQKRKKEFEEYQQSLWQIPGKSISSKGTKSSKLENKSNKLDKVTKSKTGGGKPYTKLRKRGEEWKDKTWIDDSPHDGPQMYIAISTFYDSDLPLELLKVNIPLHAVAKVILWETSSTTTRSNMAASVPTELRDIYHSLQEFRHKSTPHLNSTIRKRFGNKNDKTENSNRKISSFWKRIDKLKTEVPTALMLKNVMFLLFTPEHFSFQFHIETFQKEIYKQISYFLYDVHEITKQHIQYLSEIKQTNVYSAETIDLSNMKMYQSLLDCVPHEILNIPFLLDAVIIQVCWLENIAEQKRTLQEVKETNDIYIPDTTNNLNKLLKQLNFKYDLFGELFKYKACNEEALKNNIDSCKIKHVLKHFDDTTNTTFHLQEDIAEFVKRRTNHILQVAWNNILLDFFSVSHNDDNILKLCSEIIKTAKESDENILNYYIYIITINSIINSLLIHEFSHSTLKMNSLKESVHNERDNLCDDCILEVHNEMLSIPSILRKTVSNLSNNSSKISSYKLSDEIVGSNLFYIEYMTADVMLQWIQAIWYNFNKFETRYCPFTNQVVMVFHNLLSPKVGVFEENWLGKLTTYVPIRDFVEYILDEEKDWLSKFNSKSTGGESSKLDKVLTFYMAKPCADEIPFLFPDHQFISHRSLKYETILKQQKSGNQFKVPSTDKSKSPKSQTDFKQPDSSKKSKKILSQKQEKIVVNKLSVDSFKEETPKKNYSFIGYDLGEPMRFQFSGFKKDKVLDGCCRITLQTLEKLYGEKSQSLTVTISGHSLYYVYKPYCESTLINSFHLILSSGIVLVFGLSNKDTENDDQILKSFKQTSSKQASLLINNSILETKFLTHQIVASSILGESTEAIGSNDFTPNARTNSSYFPHSLKGAPFFEIPLLYDLKMSLPNGLHIEIAKDSSLFYIRQTFLSRSMLAKSIEQDKLRCYLSNGYIVKFFLNDTIEILSPNGLIYKVFEIKEEPIRLEKNEAMEPTEDILLEPTNPDNSITKNKRDTLREKPNESIKSSKSKKVHINDEKLADSHTSNTTFINTEKTQGQEKGKNTNPNNICNFECTTSDGKRFKAQNNNVIEHFKDLHIAHTINVAENCIDSERTDGVLTKHLADGSLLVQFKDGSCITSTPLEAGEVFCEWSSEELKQWFSDSTEPVTVPKGLQTESFLSKQSVSNHIEKSLNSRKVEKSLAAMESFHKANTIRSEILQNEHQKDIKMSVLEESNIIKSDLETIITKTSIGTLLSSLSDQTSLKKPFYHEDSFVIYHNSYLMEHPNYSSVYYNANNCEVELKLPLNTKITLKNDGCYEAYFDQASLTVDSDEIYFGKTNESGDFERTVIINNSMTNDKNPVNLSNYFNHMNSLPLSVDEFCQSIGIKSPLKRMSTKTEIKNGLLLYCVDDKINEIIIDYDFNIFELPATKDKYLISRDNFTSMIINENLSGFRLVIDEEVKCHLQLVTEKHGIIQKNDNDWNSLLTTVPYTTNETEKWFMIYQNNLIKKSKTFIKTSTFGKLESWFQPFVEKEEKCQDLIQYRAILVRLLHRIPDSKNILDKLKVAVQNYSRKTSNNYQLLRILLDEATIDFISLDDLIRNPKLLCKIIENENKKKKQEEDQFRRNMKNNLLRSLVNRAVITSRKSRKQNKENELKSALRRREIPPYHLSGFGYIHSILDEVFENATCVCSTNSSTSNFEKINYIIDELLSLVSKTKLSSTTDDDDVDNDTMEETDSIGIKRLLSNIFRNACVLIQDRSSLFYLNTIMEKPLKLVTSDDIEFIGNIVGSGDSPILQDEQFILQDVLDARLQLSNYFENLRSLLEYYRGSNHLNMSNYCIDQ